LLDEAEKKTKRSQRAALLYKEEISRLSPTKNMKKKNKKDSDGVAKPSEEDLGMKDLEIEKMRQEIEALQTKMKKQKSKVCVVS